LGTKGQEIFIYFVADRELYFILFLQCAMNLLLGDQGSGNFHLFCSGQGTFILQFVCNGQGMFYLWAKCQGTFIFLQLAGEISFFSFFAVSNEPFTRGGRTAWGLRTVAARSL